MTMRKCLLAVLSVISCCSYADVNTKIYNNYLIYSTPELSPHSITIKRQKISSTIPFNIIFTRVAGENAIIESQKNGLIFFIGKKIKGSWYIDYDKKIRLHSNSFFNLSSDYEFTNTSKFEITFNENNDIKKESLSKNDYFAINTIYNYDENKRLIDSKEKVNGISIIKKIDYTNQNLAKLITSESFIEPKLSPSDEMGNEVIEYIYDDANQLLQTKQSMHLSETKDVINMDCYFTDHNKHGDWTKGSCVLNKKNIGNFTREIECW